MASPGALRPMLAGLVDELPTGDGWLYEPKWDGFRCIAAADAGGRPGLWSRRGTDLKDGFPEVAAAVGQVLPADTIMDGEIVRWAAGGYLDFEALQRRNRTNTRGAAELARAEPCHLIVFDLLRDQGTDLIGSALGERRRRLEDLIADRPGVLVVGMQTDDLDTARLWSDQLDAVGVEGIVAKRADQPYRPGVRGWQKVKRYATTEVIIGGVTGSMESPDSVVFGRFFSGDGQLHIVGRSAELHPAAARDIAAAIQPAGDEHPWPAQLPPSWRDRSARDYYRIVPDVVAEIRVEVATSYADGIPSHWRHRLRLLRLRSDITTADVPTDLDLET